MTKYVDKAGLTRLPNPKLPHLDIELTERCNNNCVHCYINQPENKTAIRTRELTTDQWKKILDQAAKLGALTVRFTGGEPLIRSDFADIYEYTRRLGIKVMLFTNARLVTPGLVKLFKKIPPGKKIEVSVYGLHPGSYDSVAQSKGSFFEFQEGIDRLLQNNIPFVVKSVYLPQNRAELGEFVDWTRKIPWMDGHQSFALQLDLRTRRDSAWKNIKIRNLRLDPDEILTLLTREPEEYRQSMSQFASRFMYPQGDILFACEAGTTGCVDAYGNYQMCMLLRHPETVFDLTKGSLHEALSEFFPKVRLMRATNPEYLRRCARCFLKGLCEQCPGKSWTEHGTLDTPVEYLCQVAHAQARFLGLLSENEMGWEVNGWRERVGSLRNRTSGSS